MFGVTVAQIDRENGEQGGGTPMHHSGTKPADHPDKDMVGGKCLQVIEIFHHRKTCPHCKTIQGGIHQKTDLAVVDQNHHVGCFHTFFHQRGQIAGIDIKG